MKEDRLTTLNQLPLVYDRELRDLVLVYKSIFGCIDLNIEQFVSFVQHSRSRSQNPFLRVLKPSYCRTSTFQASFFNRVVKPWNYVCKIASIPINSPALLFLNASCTRHTPTWASILLVWICLALGHTRLLLPSFLNCILYIFTVNRSFFLFCYLVVLLFRGCA